MAYTVPQPEAQRRPGVVTVAVWLLVLVAALQVISAAVTLSQLSALRDAFDKLFADTAAKNAGSVMAVGNASVAAFWLLLALGFVVLAIFVGRGKNPARIITWVVAAISICCAGTNLASTAIGFGRSFGSAGSGAPTPDQVEKAINEALPTWYQPLLTTVTVVSLVALVTTVVLLALPVANPYFRKPQQQWQPPVPPPTA
jgi:hypothetical protein